MGITRSLVDDLAALVSFHPAFASSGDFMSRLVLLCSFRPAALFSARGSDTRCRVSIGKSGLIAMLLDPSSAAGGFVLLYPGPDAERVNNYQRPELLRLKERR